MAKRRVKEELVLDYGLEGGGFYISRRVTPEGTIYCYSGSEIGLSDDDNANPLDTWVDHERVSSDINDLLDHRMFSFYPGTVHPDLRPVLIPLLEKYREEERQKREAMAERYRQNGWYSEEQIAEMVSEDAAFRERELRRWLRLLGLLPEPETGKDRRRSR